MIVFLDTGPLGAITHPNPRGDDAQALKAWARRMEAAGHALIVPAVADYELRREHLRRGATTSVAALDAFIAAVPGRYLEVTDSALKRAAGLWAEVRRRGLPTADEKALDCDILIAAQILDLRLPPDAFTVVTGNVAHLSRVIACRTWREVSPEKGTAPPASNRGA